MSTIPIRTPGAWRLCQSIRRQHVSIIPDFIELSEDCEHLTCDLLHVICQDSLKAQGL